MTDKNFTWMHSGQIGAKQMNGAAGSNGQMLQVLDQALVTGFNPQTVLSATNTATTVTLTYAGPHGYEIRQLVAITGANDVALNGKHRILSKTESTITIDAVGVTVTTGTVVTSIAPLDWESIFGSTEPLKRAYRSKNIQTTQSVLYLDMTMTEGRGYNAANPAKRAMVSICENMITLGVQINSYTDTRNDYATKPNGSLFWNQCRHHAQSNAITTSVNGPWVIAGNGDYFIFLTEWQDYALRPAGYKDFYFFGDVESLAGDSDRHNCLWLGSINENDAEGAGLAGVGCATGGNPTWINTTASTKIGFFIKNHLGIGGLEPVAITHDLSYAKTTSGYKGSSPVLNPIKYPNPTSQSLIAMPLYVATPIGLRAVIPNILFIPQDLEEKVSVFDMTIDNDVLIVAMMGNAQSITRYFGFFGLNLRV